MKKTILIVSVAFAFGALVSAGFFRAETDPSASGSAESEAGCDGRFRFINANLDCGSIDERTDGNESLRESVASFLGDERADGNVVKASVFFRDLKTRRWFGVDEETNFYPASLSKLPIAMATYKIAEIDQHVLETELPVSENDILRNEARHFAEESVLQAGETYTAERLIHDMLTTSDNAPVGPLMSAASMFQESIFSDLGIFIPPTGDETAGKWNINARSYANLFRTLYNASYLRPEYSDEILRLLSESHFDDGIVAGVPDGTTVAHKYGEATVTDGMPDGGNLILNDCGVIYPEHKDPYILCVMTRGKDFAELEGIIREISETVFHSL